MTVVNKIPTRSGTNEDGEGNDAMLRQENAAHGPDHADPDMPTGNRIDLLMNTLVARAYMTPERRDVSSVDVEDGEIEESHRRSTDNIKVDAEPKSVSNLTADHIAVTRSYSAELKLQQQQQ